MGCSPSLLGSSSSSMSSCTDIELTEVGTLFASTNNSDLSLAYCSGKSRMRKPIEDTLPVSSESSFVCSGKGILSTFFFLKGLFCGITAAPSCRSPLSHHLFSCSSLHFAFMSVAISLRCVTKLWSSGGGELPSVRCDVLLNMGWEKPPTPAISEENNTTQIIAWI